jgi:hypothetical protein
VNVPLPDDFIERVALFKDGPRTLVSRQEMLEHLNGGRSR